MKWKIGDKVQIVNAECIQLGSKLFQDGDVTKVTRISKNSGLIFIRATRGKKADRDVLLYQYEMKFIKKLEGTKCN